MHDSLKSRGRLRQVSTLLACVVMLPSALSLAVGQTSSREWGDLLRSNSLRFAIPPGFVSIPVKANGDVAYDFAIRSQSRRLEIRYRVWPIDRSRGQSPGRANAIYTAMILTMGLNISKGELPETQDFPHESVRQEFGADAGQTTLVDCNSEFGQGYNKCMISVIHKDDVVDIYTFFLFDAREVISEALMTEEVFHAIRFR